MLTGKFWRQTLERAAKSAAQALIGLWTLDTFDVLHADWALAFGVAGGAAVLSVLMSIISLPLGPGDSPSAVETQ